jgi:hypothetical protein
MKMKMQKIGKIIITGFFNTASVQPFLHWAFWQVRSCMLWRHPCILSAIPHAGK